MFMDRKTQYCQDVSSSLFDLWIHRNSLLTPHPHQSKSQHYFVDNDRLILKVMWRQKTQNSQLNIEGKEQSWRTDTT